MATDSPDSHRLLLRDLIAADRADLQTGPFGTMLHASSYVDDGIPVVAVKNIGNNRLLHDEIPRVAEKDASRLDRYRLLENDILFSRKGTVERRALIRKDEVGWLQGSDCIRLRFDRSINPVFVSYYLGSQQAREWLLQHAHGATMPSLNQAILGLLPIPLPPLSEQRAIAQILGALDDKVELNRQINQTLAAIARALYSSWFVDFDPVFAKTEGRDPGLSQPLAALFTDSFEESSLGRIPKGWEVDSFASTVEIIGGGTPKTSVPEYWGGSIPWFSVVDAPRAADVWVIDTEKKITQAGIENSSARILPEGTTIISARGTVGRLALVGDPMAMNQSCYCLRGRMDTKGFFTYFTVLGLVADLQRHAHGSVFDTITRDTLNGIAVIIPPAPLTDAFERVVSPFLERIRTNLFESRTLAELRDMLLPKLISGELRVAAGLQTVEAHT